MFPARDGVPLPSPAAVQKWDSLAAVPLQTANPTTVPASTFIQIHNEGFFHHVVFESHLGIPASENVAQIRILNALITMGLDAMYELYARRGVAAPLRPISKDESTFDKTIIEAATPLFEDLIGIIQVTKGWCEEAVSSIVRLFEFPFWQNGTYSDELVAKACELFLVTQIVDELKLVKTSFTMDFTFLLKRAPASRAKVGDNEIQTLRLWLATESWSEKEILNQTKSKPIAERLVVSQCFVAHIRQALETHSYLRPEMFNAYVRTLVFFVQYVQPQQLEPEALLFLIKLAETQPLIPLAYEVSFSLVNALHKLKLRPSSNMPANPFDLDALRELLVVRMGALPLQLLAAEQGQRSPEDLYTDVSDVIKIVGDCKNMLRQQLGLKLARPPPIDESTRSMTQFERTLRKGYSEEEMTSLLRILMVWRSATDTLRASAESILRLTGRLFYESFQRFIKDTMEVAINRAPKGAKKPLEDFLSPVRETFGDWDQKEERTRSSKKPKPHPIKPSQAPPSPAAIEFLRIVVEHILRAKAPVAVRSSLLDKGSVDDFRKFLAESALWAEFLDFGGLISDLSDQSDLFFREVQLDLNREALEKANNTNFPVRSSLPFILGEFALRNFEGPALTELIFFPLGVYDDAARVAQFQLHSLFLLSEIKIEAVMCLQNLSILISEFTFGSFRSYATMRFLPETLAVTRGAGDRSLESTPYRLSTLLQQNQFFLHCVQIDIKDLIFDSLEKRMARSIQQLLHLGETQGIAQFVALGRGLEIVRETHRLLVEQGFGLLPFDVMLRVAMGVESVNSFQSPFMIRVIHRLTHRDSKGYYLRTNPLRFFPQEARELSAGPFGGGAIGKVLASALSGVSKLITVEHFCALSRILDDGAMASATAILMEDFTALTDQFVQAYKKVRTTDDVDLLRRIPDPPLGTFGQLMFERFEGVYAFLTVDEKIADLLQAMQRLGNVMAFAYMLDIAISNRNLTRSHVVGYIKGLGLDMKYTENTAARFGQFVSGLINPQDPLPTDKDVFPVIVSLCLNTLIEIVAHNAREAFAETSSTIFALDSLNGFASGWAVLEFVFLLKETTRSPNDESPFAVYGEGVFLAAAAIITVLQQERLYFATNIGRRFQRVKDVDYGAKGDERILKYCLVEQLEHASFDWGLSVWRPIAQHIRATGLIR